jgi:hypothetical protein
VKKESFEERHGDNISRLKLVLIVVCLIAIPVTFWVNHSDVGHVNSRVTKVESPCLRYGAKSEQCKAAFEQAVLTITHPEACAILRKAGLEVRECAGARLKQEHKRGNERAATKRDAAQKGVVTSNGHAPSSQPGPPSSGPSESPSVSTPPVSESANDSLPEQASSNAEPPGLLTPTTEQLPEPAKPVVEGVCSTVSHAANLC